MKSKMDLIRLTVRLCYFRVLFTCQVRVLYELDFRSCLDGLGTSHWLLWHREASGKFRQSTGMGASTGKDQESYQTYHPASSFRQNVMGNQPPSIFHVLLFVLRLSSPRMASPYVMNANVRVVGSGSWGKAGLDSLRNLYVCTWDILWTCIPLQDWVAFWTLCRFVGKQVLAFKRWREQDTASSSRRFRVMGLTKASFGTTKAETSATCNFHRSAQWQLFPKFHEALWQPSFRTIVTYCTYMIIYAYY